MRLPLIVCLVLSSGLAVSQTYVAPHYTKTGRFVPGHYPKSRTAKTPRSTTTYTTTIRNGLHGGATITRTTRERVGSSSVSTTTSSGSSGQRSTVTRTERFGSHTYTTSTTTGSTRRRRKRFGY
ncbi:MAG: hypothetical protein QOJ65_2069 [Fimbriimonadaceae bacterium]|nr:hypothetical protein [Fimbriimonadaceae bacterium]